MLRVAISGLVLMMLAGCGVPAEQYAAACDQGQPSACIAYQDALTRQRDMLNEEPWWKKDDNEDQGYLVQPFAGDDTLIQRWP